MNHRCPLCDRTSNHGMVAGLAILIQYANLHKTMTMKDTLVALNQLPIIALFKPRILTALDILQLLDVEKYTSSSDVRVKLNNFYANAPHQPNADDWLAQEESEAKEKRVERALKDLGDVGVVDVDKSSKPYRWRIHAEWVDERRAGAMASSLSFAMLKDLFRSLLSAEETAHLEPLLAHLENKHHDKKVVIDWSQRFRSLDAGPFSSGRRPVAADVLELVYHAVLNKSRFKAFYQNQRHLTMNTEPDEKSVFNPQWLVSKNGVMYLVGTMGNFAPEPDKLRQFALHRMSDVELLDEPAPQATISLDDYVNRQSFLYPVGVDEAIRLKVIFNQDVNFIPYEYFLSGDQVTEKMDDGKAVMTASVRDTSELRWWIRQLGPSIEVMEPESLRDAIKEDIRVLAERYAL